MQELLKSILKLRESCKEGFSESDDYQLLLRRMDELTVTEGDEIRVRTREDGGFHSGMLQNPSDTEATFRKKAGREHRGYAANVEEAVGVNGIYADFEFSEDGTQALRCSAGHEPR